MKHKDLPGFYHNLITDESWKVLTFLRDKYQFILIGGWAVYLYAKTLKSKDIDIVVDFSQLQKLKQDYQVGKNERLKKYEARIGSVEIDIYATYYSNPGIPAEELRKYIEVVEGFKVVSKEALAVLKGKAIMARAYSPKGRKDLIDLVSLFQLLDFNWEEYQVILKNHDLKNLSGFTQKILAETTSLPELNLNVHKMANLKKKIFVNFPNTIL